MVYAFICPMHHMLYRKVPVIIIKEGSSWYLWLYEEKETEFSPSIYTEPSLTL